MLLLAICIFGILHRDLHFFRRLLWSRAINVFRFLCRLEAHQNLWALGAGKERRGAVFQHLLRHGFPFAAVLVHPALVTRHFQRDFRAFDKLAGFGVYGLQIAASRSVLKTAGHDVFALAELAGAVHKRLASLPGPRWLSLDDIQILKDKHWRYIHPRRKL